MAIIYQFDRRHNVTYAYLSESYYDKEKKQSRAKRTLLGRVNPETKEIEPTRRTKRSKPIPTIPITQQTSEDGKRHSSVTEERLVILEAQIRDLEAKLHNEQEAAQHEREKMARLIVALQDVMARFS